MTNRLSVAYINNFGGPTIGGGEVQLLALIRGVRAAGVDVTLVCTEGSALARMAAEIDGVRVLPVSFAIASLPSLSRKLRVDLRGVDIVQGTGFLTNVVARSVGRSIGARVVNAVQVVPGAARLDGESSARSFVRETVDRASRDRVHRFIAVSHAVGDGLAERGVERGRIVVIPNGFDVAAFREAATQPLAKPLMPAKWRIGYAGRLERIKGCEYFVRAAALLRQTHPDAAFFVAGTGSLEAETHGLAVLLDIAEKIDFLGHVASIAPLLAAADVVVVPSLSEAFGLTAAEALALGVPVVASSVGGLPDIVVDGETGLLVPAGDPQALAAAVARLLDDPELAAALGAAGATRVKSEFTDEAMVAGYLAVYGDLVTG